MTAQTTLDPIAILEAGYDHLDDYERWCAEVARSCAPRFEQASECLFYDVPGPHATAQNFVSVRPADGSRLQDALRQEILAGSSNPERNDEIFAIEPIGIFSTFEVVGDDSYIANWPSDLPRNDSCALSMMDGEGMVRVMLHTSSSPHFVVEDDERPLWRCIATHLGAALRLQRQPAALDDDAVEAVLTPSGELVHASEPCQAEEVRERLRHQVKEIDRIRTRRGRQDAAQALEIWQGLLMGRWSTVDHFDSDGRRFVVARRNDPHAPSARGLTRREGQVVFYTVLGMTNLTIAYALGIAESTVSTHLARGMKKLAIATREELIALAASLEHGAATWTK
jgi:DNA-binding CsgD family transcriptional regulator